MTEPSPPAEPSPPDQPRQPARPTLEDVAARAGVSRSLVSLVMRDSPQVSERSRRAVRRAAEELGYRPNLMARNLASQRTRTIGVVLNDLYNPYFASLHDSIVTASNDHDYELIMNSGRGSAAAEAQAISAFVSFQVEGIIMAGAGITDDGIHELVASTQTPVVVVGRPASHPAIDSVSIDSAEGTELAIRHLHQLGHRHIAHIDGGDGAGARPRREAYAKTMAELGLGQEIRIVGGDFTEAGGSAGAEQLMAGSGMTGSGMSGSGVNGPGMSGSGMNGPGMTGSAAPTAIFAANDLTAIGAVGWLMKHGYSVPDDVSVIGFDNIWIAQLRQVDLTTLNQPTRAMGSRAVELLLERLDGDRRDAAHVVERPELIARSSSGPPPDNGGTTNEGESS